MRQYEYELQDKVSKSIQGGQAYMVFKMRAIYMKSAWLLCTFDTVALLQFELELHIKDFRKGNETTNSNGIGNLMHFIQLLFENSKSRLVVKHTKKITLK